MTVLVIYLMKTILKKGYASIVAPMFIGFFPFKKDAGV